MTRNLQPQTVATSTNILAMSIAKQSSHYCKLSQIYEAVL